ncbi:cytochrome P450 [Gyrodon lividus]|nr:cytochrome P450 [Gyrodon lividus]
MWMQYCETMRWHSVTPISVPHGTNEDDIYTKAITFRKNTGATIIANVWAMSHNEVKYPNPATFLPERFLESDGTLNDDKVPRVCPGKHVADASLWCAMVCMLALFKIEKTEGSEQVKWTTGLASHPLPFPCKFVPRDEDTDGQKLASLIYASRIDL